MQQHSREEKQAHLDRWRQSGLTQQAYCEQHGLNASSFKSWGYSLRSRQLPGFIPAHVIEPIVLQHPNGIRVTLPVSCLPEILRIFAAC